MPTSGLIIAFVVVVWAAYFIPLALRRYEEAGKNASVETTGSLSRVIQRRDTVVEVVEESVVVERVATPPAAGPAPAVAAVSSSVRTLDRPAARLAARRRRRTLLTLLALTVVVVGLAAAGVIATPWAAAPVALVAAWLVACRIQVRGELGIARVKAPKTSRTEKTSKAEKLPRKRSAGKAPARAADEEETIIVSGQFEDINPGRKHEMEVAALEEDALDDRIVIAVPSVSTTGEALWDPLPVTLPTYVTKPRAGRTVRTIDFSQPNTWTSGHIEGEDVEMPKRDGGAQDERRAVGH